MSAGVVVGLQLPELQVRLTRTDLVRYAGASLDFNPIHHDEASARAVGLPGVIAHGMLTMALGARCVAEWCGDPAAILDLGVRFTRPVVVGDEGAVVTVGGRVSAVDPATATATVALTVTVGGHRVLGKSTAVVSLR